MLIPDMVGGRGKLVRRRILVDDDVNVNKKIKNK